MNEDFISVIIFHDIQNFKRKYLEHVKVNKETREDILGCAFISVLEKLKLTQQGFTKHHAKSWTA